MRQQSIKTIISVFLFFFLVTAVEAQPNIKFNGKVKVVGGEIEILVDSNSNIGLEAAKVSKLYQKSTEEFPNLLTTSYSYWVRFRIQNLSESKILGIQLSQPIVDYVDFYQLNGDSVVLKNLSGHRRPFYSRIINHQTYIYPLDIRRKQGSTIYFYVKSGKQLILPIYMGTIEQVVERAFIKDISFGIYFGIILVMILYNLFVYTSVRDKNYLYYVSYLFIVLLTQASMEGYFFRFVLPANPALADISIYITTALIGIAAIEFSKSFLHSKEFTPRLHKVSYLFWGLYATQVALAFSGQYNASYTIMLISAMISALYVLGMSIMIISMGSRSARFFFIAWSGFILCVVIYVLKDFNILLPYNDITNSALLIGSAFEAVMLSFALADKINVFKAEKEQSQEQVVKALKENERIIREQNVLLEEKVKERTTELQSSNSELNTTLVDLKQTQTQLVESEKMASLGQLTAGIAHEINNPINFVTSNVAPLQRDVNILMAAISTMENLSMSDISVEEKQKRIEDYKEEIDYDYLKIEISHLLKGINEGASRTAEIVKGLRVFSRLDEDDLKHADIHEGLESTLIIANNLLNDIKLSKEYGELPLVECYPGKLNQVFLNIISNAAHAINKRHGVNSGKGEILIRTGFRGDQIFIHFSDNGTGMDENTMKKIFEPFFTTKDVGEGTGLGMSIAYNTIKKHNGHIKVESTMGEGTEFVIDLPIVNKISET